MTKPWALISAACIAIVAGVVIVRWFVQDDPLRAQSRRDWKDRAVARIERRLGGERVVPAGGDWVGEGVLVMGNGEWIVCENVCRKEAGRVHDLFVGRGSDGRWYYSTFHFCKGLTVLRMGEPRPASLAEFADAYWVATWDGRSDACLKETWTGGAWGRERVGAK